MKLHFILVYFFVCIALVIASCSHYELYKHEKKVSKNGEDESHNNGMNCMNCHFSGGKGEGWFNLAGSVYKANKISQNPDGKIHLYTSPNGQGSLKYSIDVDEKGNFYTTEPIAFDGGLYPVHENNKGVKKYMASPIVSGQCQSCHNATTDNIWND